MGRPWLRFGQPARVAGLAAVFPVGLRGSLRGLVPLARPFRSNGAWRWRYPALVMGRMLARDAELVIASHNPGKVAELTELFAPSVRSVRSAAELGLLEPEEPADSFVGNASIKALAASRAAGRPAVSDDSGLVVPVLGGAPGVRSARWAGPSRDFGAAMAAVWEALAGRDPRSSMVCALALAWPDGDVEAVEGRVEGVLVWPPRGALGFGYEPMFQPLGSDRTYGEMPRSEKHRDDPRARAFAALVAAAMD
jgi:XTP/dITP diphosphohydrolase